jgi:hypothetical protein
MWFSNTGDDGVPKNLDYSLVSDKALTITGHSRVTDAYNSSRFMNFCHTFIIPDNLNLSRGVEAVAEVFGRVRESPVGMLGFGSTSSKIITGFLKSSMSSLGGSLPIWSLSMPRNEQEQSFLVIGGFISIAHAPSAHKISITIPAVYKEDTADHSVIR